MLKIIKDEGKLKAHITKTMKNYRTNGDDLHVSVVSALDHTAEHGDPSHLNRVYADLRTNDQQAMKAYIHRCSVVVGMSGADIENLPTETVIAAVETGSLVTMKKGEFIVVNGPKTDVAKLWMKILNDRFIEPDGKRDKKVLERNNFAEIKTLGDTQVLKQIEALAAKLANDTDNVKVTVSDPVRKLVDDTAEKAFYLRDQLSLSAA